MFTPTYRLSVDYKLGLRKYFKRPHTRPPTGPNRRTWTFARKIGSQWAFVLCFTNQTSGSFKIKVFPIMYPQISQRLNIKETIIQKIRDSLEEADAKTCDQIAILKMVLKECIICAGSPPVFFVQEPFTSRPNTRVRAQIEQVQAGIPFDSRPSTLFVLLLNHPAHTSSFFLKFVDMLHHNYIILFARVITECIRNFWADNLSEA